MRKIIKKYCKPDLIGGIAINNRKFKKVFGVIFIMLAMFFNAGLTYREHSAEDQKLVGETLSYGYNTSNPYYGTIAESGANPDMAYGTVYGSVLASKPLNNNNYIDSMVVVREALDTAYSIQEYNLSHDAKGETEYSIPTDRVENNTDSETEIEHNTIPYGTTFIPQMGNSESNLTGNIIESGISSGNFNLPYGYSTSSQGGLIDITFPDSNYSGTTIYLSDSEKTLCENLVFGEAGNQGFIGCALVAQAIRDACIYEGFASVASVRSKYQYSGSIYSGTNQDAIDAVNFIFNQGGYVVQHRIMFFYSSRYMYSSWHESMPFVIEYKDHRFFDTPY